MYEVWDECERWKGCERVMHITVVGKLVVVVVVVEVVVEVVVKVVVLVVVVVAMAGQTHHTNFPCRVAVLPM